MGTTAIFLGLAIGLALLSILQRLSIMNDQLTALTTAVTDMETVADSAIVLLNGLKSALDAAIEADDPAALEALSARLGEQSAELAAALTANTPAAAPVENPAE